MQPIDNMLYVSPDTSINHIGEMCYTMRDCSVLRDAYSWLAGAWWELVGRVERRKKLERQIVKEANFYKNKGIDNGRYNQHYR